MDKDIKSPLRGRSFASREEAKAHLGKKLQRWPGNYLDIPEAERFSRLVADAELGRAACRALNEYRRLAPVWESLDRFAPTLPAKIAINPPADAVSPAFRPIADWLKDATAALAGLDHLARARAANAPLRARALSAQVQKALEETGSEKRMMVAFVESAYGLTISPDDLEALVLWIGLRDPTTGTIDDQDKPDGPEFAPSSLVVSRRVGRWSNLKLQIRGLKKTLARALGISGE